MSQVSVVICTHNPRQDHLERTLASLKKQGLPQEFWELLVVDNASSTPVAGLHDLAWHANARHVVEPKLGLTMARIRGIAETASEVILFVDDDNVLAPNYLSTVLEIMRREPQLGVIGAGRLEPEFEETPDPELMPYMPMLALRTVPVSRWSNDPEDKIIPWGAGMAVTRAVAEQYRRMILADPLKQRLDRAGNTLNSCGDDEFSWVACEMGSGKGLFTELQVTHLIGRARLQREYLLRLAEGHAFSRAFLVHLHGGVVHRAQAPPSLTKFLGRLARLRLSEAMYEGERWARYRSLTEVERAFGSAKLAGIERFFHTIQG
ncbi:MAG: glycosyltransferase family 2 protein [Flavobacteriales bacterium]|nr:glycosyltransferase family 2 protein [Flavobacteriales bacterium]